jgi:C4-dicarboxylate-specific signal transduction histidine kinase
MLILISIFARHLLKSIKAIRLGTTEIENGNFNYQISRLPQDELGQLSDAFNRMSEALRLRTSELETERARTVNNARLSSLGEMAGNIAHEINTPLAIITLCTDELVDLNEEKTLTPEKIESNLIVIRKTVQRVTDIIRSLRKYSRNGSQDPMEKIKMEQLLNDTKLLCNEKLKHGTIRLEIDPELLTYSVNCRGVEVCQVLVNLINNSFDAIQSLPERWIKINFEKLENKFLYFSISDSGSGISANTVKRLFEPFFTTKEAGKGTGLGLSISANIIKSHGGTLLYDPETTHTKFIISLPNSVS